MKTIDLKNGYKAAVDDQDYEWLMNYRWVGIEIHGKGMCPVNRFKNRLWFMDDRIMKATCNDYVHHKDGDHLNNTRDNLAMCNRKLRYKLFGNNIVT